MEQFDWSEMTYYNISVINNVTLLIVVLCNIQITLTRELCDLMHEGGANNSRDCTSRRRVRYPWSRPLLALPECVKPRNSQVTCDLTVLVLSCVTFTFLCPTVATVLLPIRTAKCALRNLEHSKVCSKRFNVPSGDMFRAIRLAGGNVVSSKYNY